MLMWAEKDVAIAVKDEGCVCGHHRIRQRHAYRVRHILVEDGETFLDVSTAGPDEHYYHHSYFRREQPATQDIFKLADAPVDKRVLEPNI